MGFRVFGSFLILTLLCTKTSFGQRPNPEESFILKFLQEMGLKSRQDKGFSGSFCSWKGLVCDDSEEHVVELNFSGLHLTGQIPDSTIGKLTMLKKLDLSNNQITALPSDFWDLGSLHTLNLSNNRINGSLSSNIVNFGHLQSLDLSFNNFSGNIPEGISSLAVLRALNLSRNGFESAIPLGICQCKSLVSIDLSENKLIGPLPNDFGFAFPQLRFLILARNQILGHDLNFRGMRLNYLNISSNFFNGSVEGLFDGPLQVIDLSKNQFEGHIAQANFSSTFDFSNLVYLDLSENQLNGECFTSLTHARNLKHLNLAFNRFTKQVMQADTLANLEYLNLSSTNLIGRITINMSRLTHLRTLDLSKNQLSSHIPSAFKKSLEILDLSHNNLTGNIPPSLIDELHEMERFNLSYNNLSFCGTRFTQQSLQSAFIGSVNSCPIAAKPAFFPKKAPRHKGLKIALVLTISMVCLLVGLLVLAFRCQRKSRMWAVKRNSSYMEEGVVSGPFSFQTDSTTWVADVKQATSVPVVIFEKPLLNFTFADLLSATSNFERGTMLAEGRFGPVYSGLLPGGIHVAVKVLVHGSIMTDNEAAKELEYLGRIKHPNLVPLSGYCLAGDQRIAIYEYMENGNLQNLLHDLPLGVPATEDWSTDTWEGEEDSNGIRNVGSEGSPDATWRVRYKIAVGSARALAFLHHGCSPPIIHRDVRASSVYLDSNLEPRLSDFGLAKIFGNGLKERTAHGLPGYLPPEFLHEDDGPAGGPTPKSDVYGFGVVLFELVTGKRAMEDVYPDEKDGNLVSWVRGLVRSNEGLRAVDPKVRGSGPDGQMVEALKIGYLCTAEIPTKRPSMHQVVGLLKDLEQITA